MATIPFAPPPSTNILGTALGVIGGIQGLRQRQLANKLAQMQQQYYPQEQQADIAYKRAQTAKALTPDTANMLKNPFYLLHMGNKIFSQNPQDPRLSLIGGLISKLTSSGKGIGITTTPSGGTKVQIGGAQQPSTQDPSLWGEPIVNPLTKGSRGAKGITYSDAKTGNIYSTPTVQETAKLQQSVLSEQQINNLVNDLVSQTKKANYFDPETHLKAFMAPALAISPALQQQFPQAGKAKSNLLNIGSSVTNAAERAITQGNLPRTEETRKDLMKIFQPVVGETDYEGRVRHQLGLFLQNAQLQRNALIKGVKVGASPYLRVRKAPASFMDYMHPQYEYIHNPNYRKAPRKAATPIVPQPLKAEEPKTNLSKLSNDQLLAIARGQ